MVAPCGIARPAQRMPTVWLLESNTSSRSLLVRVVEPPAASSASSADAATRFSTVAAVDAFAAGQPVVLRTPSDAAAQAYVNLATILAERLR